MAESTAASETKTAEEHFPRVYWAANVTELFERAAYYSMASFVVLYAGRLGLGDYLPSTLNSLLWGLVYFLPILSGTIADQIGFRRALLLAFVLLAGGYFLMGSPVWIGGAPLAAKASAAPPAGLDVILPLVAGILLIGVGGSFVKPCISGTVQKTAGGRATLAFAIFYMVINIGSLVGRGTSYVVRTEWTFTGIFAVAMAAAAVAFVLVLLVYRDPDTLAGSAAPPKPRKPVGRILLDMVLVLRNLRFALFLLVTSGFWFLYLQVYNIIPLYLEHVVQKDPPVDLYTMANPITIVLFQLLVTRFFGKMKPVRSMVVGAIIISVSMVINLLPYAFDGGVQAPVLELLPMGGLFIVMTVSLVAFGELFTSARTFEYIGALAPKGQEGLFLGYSNLPTAIGALIAGPAGAAIFHEIMLSGAEELPNGLKVLDPASAAAGWLLLMGIGFASATSLWLYNRWIEKSPR